MLRNILPRPRIGGAEIWHAQHQINTRGVNRGREVKKNATTNTPSTRTCESHRKPTWRRYQSRRLAVKRARLDATAPIEPHWRLPGGMPSWQHGTPGNMAPMKRPAPSVKASGSTTLDLQRRAAPSDRMDRGLAGPGVKASGSTTLDLQRRAVPSDRMHQGIGRPQRESQRIDQSRPSASSSAIRSNASRDWPAPA